MTATLTRPIALPVKPAHLPDDLTSLDQWVVWSYEWVEGEDGKPGKWDKPPRNARTGDYASTTNVKSWVPFADALQTLKMVRYDGIGYVVAHDDPFYVTDIDHCLTSGQPSEMARSIVDRTRGYLYWEASPSGTGLRGIGRGTLPPTGRKNSKTGFEVYCTGRYVTMTGHVFEGCDRIGGDSTAIIAEIHRERFGDALSERTETRQTNVILADDIEIIERLRRCRNGAVFERLMQGSTADHGGDDSAADASLIARLLWANGGDVEQAIRIASTSLLWRPKWESRRGDTDYIRYTAERILARMCDFYNPYHGRPVRTWVGALPSGESARFVAVQVRG